MKETVKSRLDGKAANQNPTKKKSKKKNGKEYERV